MAMGGGGMNLGGAVFTVTANTAQLEQGLRQAEHQAQQTGRAIGQAGKTGAQGLLELSRAIEDAQYGFNAIVNNIPGIVTGLGMGVGVAAAASIAAVAINQLLKHVGDITDAFQAGWTGQAQEELTRVRELADMAAESFEKLAKTPTKARAAQAKGVAGLITEDEDALKHVAEAVAADPRLRAKAERAQGAQVMAGAPGVIPQAGPTQEQLNQKAMAENVETAKRLLGEAALPGRIGEHARQTLIGMAKQNPGAFPPGFASDIEAQSPEGQKRQREFEAKLKRQEQIEAQIARDTERKNAAAEKQSRDAGRQEQEKRERELRLNQMHEQWTAQDKIEALRDYRQRIAEIAPNKPFRGDYFEYATSHGESYAEKQQIQKLKDIDTKIKDAVNELKALNRKNQEARAG